jgi:diguanylate cyclase (GGDEF)-like protein/PAS domain S-box-containing protein
VGGLGLLGILSLGIAWKRLYTPQSEATPALTQTYQTLVEDTDVPLVLVDAHTRSLLAINSAFEQLSGYTGIDSLALSLGDILLPEPVADTPSSGIEISQLLGVQHLRSAEGQFMSVTVSSCPIVYEDRKLWLVTFRELSRSLLPAATPSFVRQPDLTDLVNSFPGILFRRAPTSEAPMQYVSQGCLLVTGYPIEALTGTDAHAYNTIIDRNDWLKVLPVLEAAITESQSYSIEYRIITQAGAPKWVWERGSIAYDAQGQVQGLEGFITDIHDLKQAEEELRRGAFYDKLTGLPNRALFMDRLDLALKRTQRHHDHLFAVLFLDLDRFKVINDSLGHLAGDRLLVAVAQCLQGCLRPSDTIARLGGDEFTVLLEDVRGIDDVTQVSNRILKALSYPFSLDGQEVFTSSSIGIALSHIGYQHPEELLRDADIALYRAKALGKVRYEIFTTEMRDQALAQMQMETSLRRAIENQEFLLHYQPIIALDSGKPIGFEALLRWQHPERGLVSPTEFIPIAEETGLMLPIGWWVLREGCRQLNAWRYQFPDHANLSMSINLSTKQFAQTDLVEQLQQVLASTGLDPSRLWLEITEGVIMDNAEFSAQRLNQLKELGVKFCVDDFGTGYSSLSYLHRFPVDRLKIDRSFIASMHAQRNLEIVRSIITLAHNLNMDVVAEGIETGAQLAHIRAFVCEYGQGFFFSKPLSAQAAEELLRTSFSPAQLPQPGATAVPQLKMRTHSGYTYIPLVGKTAWTIGRSKDSAILISDRWSSHQHAVLQTVGNDDIYLVDLGSRNGSFVNGQRIMAPVLLQAGDRLKVGKTELEFQMVGQTSSPLSTELPKKTVLMIQSSKFQGEIWREVLTAQGVSVIWQFFEIELPQSFEQLAITPHTQIDLLLLDIQTPKPNPYVLCRLCRSHYPQLKVIFTTVANQPISPLDRRWAQQMGAIDLLSGFREAQNLLAYWEDMIPQINLVLQNLEHPPIDQKKLASSLLSLQTMMRRDTLF